MKTNNSIPADYESLVTLGRKALAGANSIGAEIELGQNTAAKISADLYDVIGDPATPTIPGKQQRYLTQRTVVKNAYTAKGAARRAGREFCRLAISLLRPALGTRWNNAWLAAGFTRPSLALPQDPTAMLTAFRGYFAANPARENAPTSITAAQAQALLAALDATALSIGAERSALLVRKAERDAALAKLTARMSGLRGELDQLLADDDGRWYEFGFRRSDDGAIPSVVEELVLTASGPGVVLANWAASSRAENYRVVWRASSSSDPAVEIGLFTEPQATLMDLPSGVPIIIGVSARNDSGETAVTEASIVVP